MNAPHEKFYRKDETKGLMVLFRIISRHSWDELQSWHRALPGSRVEHLMFGLYVLHVEPGGARRLAS